MHIRSKGSLFTNQQNRNMCKPAMAEPALATTLWQKLQNNVVRTKFRHELNRAYATNADFMRMIPEHKRVVVIGCTGAGKSTLLNTLGGCKKVWKEQGDEEGTFEWDAKKGPNPVFESGYSAQSVTQHTSFANLRYLGEKNKPFIVVDTPGHDDPEGANIDEKDARAKLQEQAADLHSKLQNMMHLNMILVMHNDVHSNRLNPATYELLRKVDEMFKDSDRNVWEHVVMAYTKCDADSRGWKDNLASKKLQMQESLRRTFPRCTIDIPILTLSGVSVEGTGNTALSRDFNSLWSRLSAAPALDTTRISRFEGLDVRIGRIVEGRDNALRVAEARKEFPQVSGNVLMLVFTLIVRSFLLPFLDIPGIADEVALFSLLAYRTGFYKVWDWGAVLWDDVMLPKVIHYVGFESILSNFRLIKLEKTSVDSDEELGGSASRKSKEE